MRPAGSSSSCPTASPRPLAATVLEVRGPLADPYGQLEIRPAADGVSRSAGHRHLPAPIDLGAGGSARRPKPGSSTLPARSPRSPTKATSGDIALCRRDAGRDPRPRHGRRLERHRRDDASSKGATYRLTGIAGQRASRKGALDGYRVWLRDAADVELVAAPSPSPSSPSAARPRSRRPARRRARRQRAGRRPSRLDRRGAADHRSRRGHRGDRDRAGGPPRRDRPADRRPGRDRRDRGPARRRTSPPRASARGSGPSGRVGTRVRRPAPARGSRSSGSVPGRVPAPLRVRGPLTAAHTWRLVPISGRIDDVRKLGDRWRAEVVVGAARLVVVGQPGARIPVDGVIEGRSIEVDGIVRPAYPSASDRRPTILPRSRGDLRVGGGRRRWPTSGAGGADGRWRRRGGATASRDGTASGGTDAAETVPDADLADLASIVGDDRPRRRPRPRRPARRVRARRRHGARAGGAARRRRGLDPAHRARGRDQRHRPRRAARRRHPGRGRDGSGRDRPRQRPGRARRGRPRTRERNPAEKELASAARPRSAGFGDDLGGLPGAGAGLASLARDQPRVGRGDPPAPTPGPPTPGRPGGRAAVRHRRRGGRRGAVGGVRRRGPTGPAAAWAERGPIGSSCVGRAWPDGRHPRSATLDSRTNRGLSSAEFRASEAAT